MLTGPSGIQAAPLNRKFKTHEVKMPPNDPTLRKQYNHAYYVRNRAKALDDAKVRYESDKAYFLEKNARRKSELRAMITEIKKQATCSMCGFRDYRALTFHHKDPSEKEFNLGSIKGRGVGARQLIAELSKCEILCANCHMIIHYQEDANNVE